MPKQDIKKLERKEKERLGITEEKPKWGKEKEKERPLAEKTQKMEQIVRLAETNIDGAKPVRSSIRAIKGVSFMFANAVGNATGLGNKKISELTEEEKKKVEDAIYRPENYGIPVWMMNRRREPATGLNRHIIASQLQLTKQTDIGEMKKMKTYKGVRHALGLPVRGQRTKNTGRKKGSTVGVRKKKEMPAKAEGQK